MASAGCIHFCSLLPTTINSLIGHQFRYQKAFTMTLGLINTVKYPGSPIHKSDLSKSGVQVLENVTEVPKQHAEA